MMCFVGLPLSLWGYALDTAAHLLNKVPSKSVSSTPYEIWKGKMPDLKHVKVWGCPTHVRRHDLDKLESKTEKCRFVGYPKETYGYYFYQPSDQRVFVAKRAVFLEEEYILQGNSGSKVDLEEVLEPQTAEMTSEESIQQDIQTVRRSSRVPIQPDRYVGHISDRKVHCDEDDDPQTYEEAMQGIDSGKWLEAMNSEMDSMYSNQV